MEINDFLRPSEVLAHVRAADKPRLLKDLAARTAAIVNVPADRIASELIKREALGSTGTGGGVAIPHARLPEVKKPFGMLVRLRQAIDFEPWTKNQLISSSYCLPQRQRPGSSSTRLPAWRGN